MLPNERCQALFGTGGHAYCMQLLIRSVLLHAPGSITELCLMWWSTMCMICEAGWRARIAASFDNIELGTGDTYCHSLPHESMLTWFR